MRKLLRLASMQSWRNRESRVHSNHSRIEVEFGHAFEAPGRALFDTYAAAFAIVHKDLVKPVRTRRTHDARLRADEITIIASVAGAATEAAACFQDGLLFAICLNNFLFRRFAERGREHVLLDAWEVREIGHVHAVQIDDDVYGNRARLERNVAQHL